MYLPHLPIMLQNLAGTFCANLKKDILFFMQGEILVLLSNGSAKQQGLDVL